MYILSTTCCIVFSDCGVPQMHRGGTIDFHGLYSKPVYYDCVWKLHTETEMRVSVKMLDLTMESGECQYDE